MRFDIITELVKTLNYFIGVIGILIKKELAPFDPEVFST